MGIKNIPIAEAQSGLVVASAVCDNSGRVIIPAGGRLTPMAIKRLPKWGITTVPVEIVDEEGGAEISSPCEEQERVSADEEELAFATRITQLVSEKFSTIEPTYFNEEYRRLVIKYLIEKGKNVVPGL